MIVYGGNKQRRDKFDRNVMTNPLIIRFGELLNLKFKFRDSSIVTSCIINSTDLLLILGSVKTLEEMSICAVKRHFDNEDTQLNNLPLKLQTTIMKYSQYTPHSDCYPIIIYPLENNFVK